MDEYFILIGTYRLIIKKTNKLSYGNTIWHCERKIFNCRKAADKLVCLNDPQFQLTTRLLPQCHKISEYFHKISNSKYLRCY